MKVNLFSFKINIRLCVYWLSILDVFGYPLFYIYYDGGELDIQLLFMFGITIYPTAIYLSAFKRTKIFYFK